MSFDPTINASLAKHALERGDRLALVDGQRRVSYQDLHAEVSRVARGFTALGLAARDRVAVFLDSSIDAAIAISAALSAGFIAVPINPRLKPQQVAHILDDCCPRILVTSAWRQRELASQCSLMNVVVVISLVDLVADVSISLHRTIDLDAAAILYTSGSTGLPKGVVVSHRNLTSGAASVVEYLGLAPEDVILATLPLSFDAGLSQLTTGFTSGATVVLHSYIRPNDLATACARHGVTSITAVPPLWRQIVDARWAPAARDLVRRIASTGGHLTIPLLERMRATFPAAKPFLMYGLTEAFRSTYLDPSRIDERPGSIGKSIPNNEILVLDERGQRCLPGQLGELVHRGATVALGYWNRPDETAASFRILPHLRHGLIPEYAVWSGDLVRLDADGFLYFHGRRDELLKSSGYRISPEEIEGVLANAPGVIESAVFGWDDHDVDPRIVGAVVLTEDASLESILAYLSRHLPAYMIPELWKVDTLPRSPNGKIDRHVLRVRYSG